MSGLVDYRHEDGVATLTMDDGKVNVMSVEMLRALDAALDRAEKDMAIIVLRSARPGVFSAGFDLKVFAANDADLKGALDGANAFLATPDVVASPEVLSGLTTTIREAFAKNARPVPATYLEDVTERSLLERRAYQKRSVFGEPHLRGQAVKQFGNVVKVIEVNDNPNIDFGVEDLVLKEQIYRRIMEYFVKKLDAQTRLREPV